VIHLSLRHHKGRDCRGWPSIRRKYGRKRATSGMSTDPLLVLYSLANPPKPMNWADDVDDEAADAPKIEERDEGNGIKVITEYRTNAEGKKVKVSLRTKNISFPSKHIFQYSSSHLSLQITRRIRRTLVTTKVNAAEAERKQWAKFGLEKGRAAGPHSSTTTVAESILLKMSAGNKHVSSTLKSYKVDSAEYI
jgi:hypothetical protein